MPVLFVSFSLFVFVGLGELDEVAWGFGDVEASFGGAGGRGRAPAGLKLECVELMAKVAADRVHSRNDIGTALVHKFQAEITNAGSAPHSEMPGRGLDGRVEYSVSTSDIGQDRMHAPRGVPQRHLMPLAGLSAIRSIRPVRKKTAKDTMFSMEDGQMLIRNHL